jgi:hypothetical protein
MTCSTQIKIKIRISYEIYEIYEVYKIYEIYENLSNIRFLYFLKYEFKFLVLIS